MRRLANVPTVAWWALGYAVAASGGLLALFLRPWGHVPVGHVPVGHVPILAWLERSYTIHRALRVIHSFGAWVLVVAWMVCLVFALVRKAGRSGPWSSWAPRVLVLVGFVAVMALGYLVPWAAWGPWSVHPGPNMMRPVPVSDNDGPFPELVAVNLRYARGWQTIAGVYVAERLAIGLAVAHAGLPLAGLLGWVGHRRRSGRRPDARSRGTTG